VSIKVWNSYVSESSVFIALSAVIQEQMQRNTLIEHLQPVHITSDEVFETCIFFPWRRKRKCVISVLYMCAFVHACFLDFKF